MAAGAFFVELALATDLGGVLADRELTFLEATLAEGFATALDAPAFADTAFVAADLGLGARAVLTERSGRNRKVSHSCPSSRAHHRSESTRRTKVGDHISS